MKIINSLATENQLRLDNNQSENILKKLATAKRINSAADDAAGLQIVDRLTAQANSASQGMRNLYDGISMANVADQALSGFSDGLAELESLTVQAGNGALSSADREAIAEQASQISQSMQQQISNTTFGGVKLFDESKEIAFSVGDSLVKLQTPGLENVVSSNNLDAIDFNSEAGRAAAQDAIRGVAKEVNSARAQIGASSNNFASTARGLANQNENIEASLSRIQDLDYAKAVTEKVASGIREQASVSVISQARVSGQQALNLLA